MIIENFKHWNTKPIRVQAGDTITAEVDSVLLSSGLMCALVVSLREQLKYAQNMLGHIERDFIALDIKHVDPKKFFLGIGALRTEQLMYETQLEQLGVEYIEGLLDWECRKKFLHQ